MARPELIEELIKDAPPEQIKEVLKDVKILAGDDEEVTRVATDTIRAYDLKHFTEAKYEMDGKERKFLLSSHGEVGSDSGLYYDPSTKACVKYDHLAQSSAGLVEDKGEDVKRLQGGEEAEAQRKALEARLGEAYIKENYPFGVCTVYSTASSSGGGGGAREFAVCISSTVYKPRSYWSGRWTSEWIVAEGGGQSFALKGKCDVATHYYENGNVQFKSNRSFPETKVKPGSDPAASAEAVVAAIAEAELRYQEDLQESLRDFAESTFKKLRRQLPLTQLKFPWATGAASLATELVKKQKA